MESIREVPAIQLATVDDGKIVALEAFSDASEYNRMLVEQETSGNTLTRTVCRINPALLAVILLGQFWCGFAV